MLLVCLPVQGGVGAVRLHCVTIHRRRVRKDEVRHVHVLMDGCRLQRTAQSGRFWLTRHAEWHLQHVGDYLPPEGVVGAAADKQRFVAWHAVLPQPAYVGLDWLWSA